MALLGLPSMSAIAPLLGDKRTCLSQLRSDVIDPVGRNITF